MSLKRGFVQRVGICDIKYAYTSGCLLYDAWEGMLKRCYNPKYHMKNPSYIGCSVVEEWLTFSNFKTWAGETFYEGLKLDKDILVSSNVQYAPETCCFVPTYVNGLLTNSKVPTGTFLGASLLPRKSGQAWGSAVRCLGVKSYLGSFSTAEEAHMCWQYAKAQAIKDTVEKYSNEVFCNVRVVAALLNRAEKLISNACAGVETTIV